MRPPSLGAQSCSPGPARTGIASRSGCARLGVNAPLSAATCGRCVARPRAARVTHRPPKRPPSRFIFPAASDSAPRRWLPAAAPLSAPVCAAPPPPVQEAEGLPPALVPRPSVDCPLRRPGHRRPALRRQGARRGASAPPPRSSGRAPSSPPRRCPPWPRCCQHAARLWCLSLRDGTPPHFPCPSVRPRPCPQVHRDIKSCNILLDEYLHPMVRAVSAAGQRQGGAGRFEDPVSCQGRVPRKLGSGLTARRLPPALGASDQRHGHRPPAEAQRNFRHPPRQRRAAPSAAAHISPPPTAPTHQKSTNLTPTHPHTQNLPGTDGYLDPEYAQNGELSLSTDVYSYGIILLEMLSSTSARGQAVRPGAPEAPSRPRKPAPAPPPPAAADAAAAGRTPT